MSKGNNTSAYRSIAKGTAMMGGVQVFNIIINVLRGKLVAIFLGPSGMGISSLLNSTVLPIQQFTSLGLSLSAVKNVAELQSSDDIQRYNHISIIRTLSFLTAILGAIVLIICAPYLSKVTFGDESYTWHLIFLSVMVFFTTMAEAERSVLQGSHALKRLAYSSLIGSGTGLFIGVPLYFFFGEYGIVPAMVVLSIVMFYFYRYHEAKLYKSRLFFSIDQLREFTPLIKTLLSLGIISMVSTLLGTVCNYTINAFVRHTGGIEDVGFYQAANSITNQYVALVFSAMSMDYFPRLAAVSHDNQKIRNIVNAQTEIILLVISPIISLMICLAPIMIEILLTTEFIVLKPVIRVFAIAVFFKSLAYPMGYISFAKGDKKTFFWLEGVYGNIVLLIISIFTYYYWGLIGLAIALLCTYVIVLITYFIVTRHKYSYKMDRSVIKLILVTGSLNIACFLCSLISNLKYSYFFMGVFTVVSVAISLVGLEKRIKLFEFFKNKISKI